VGSQYQCACVRARVGCVMCVLGVGMGGRALKFGGREVMAKSRVTGDE
jgi:hypothetical protein